MEVREIQKKIQDLEKKNNWLNSSDEKMTFLVEEMGEIARWVRKARKKRLVKLEKKEFGLEFADVLQHLISLANEFGIDLEEALKIKKGL